MERSVPFDLQAERATLGAILLDRDAIIAIAAWLAAEFFYLEKHALIYEAMLACYNRREPPDLATVAAELRRQERLDLVGGIAFLGELLAEVPTAVHIEYYARNVERTAILRRLIETGGKIAALGYDESEELDVTLDKAEAELFTVSQRRSTQDFVPIGQIVNTLFTQIERLQERRGEVAGVATGYHELDALTGGLQPSDLIILAARPGVGKTSLSLSIAYNIAFLSRATVGIFSLEMSRDQLVQRILSMHTGIDMQRLRTGNLRADELNLAFEGMGVLSDLPIYIEDTPGLSITEVRSKARRLAAETGCNMLMIDYLQLMSGRRNDNRVQEVSEISRGLKALARELNVPIIALSQLSRAVEGRTSHVPMLSDLRESGCLAGETLVYLPDEGTSRRIDHLVGHTGFRVLALNLTTWKLEPRPLTNAFATGHKPVYRLTTRRGHTIRATGNHKFITVNGWRRLDQLHPGEHLALPTTMRSQPHHPLELPRLTPPPDDLIPAAGWQSCLTTGLSPRHQVLLEQMSIFAAPQATSSLLNRPLARTSAQRIATALQAEALALLASADVTWDEIVSIESAGATLVYDLTVDEHHSFVANNLVVSNSIEQDADIVMFIYREELYDKETDKKGLAEIHLSKHRNGPLGVIPLRFEARTTRFQNLERYLAPEGY